MLSLKNALLFSFCKRSFVLGSILLLVMILSMFGIGEAIWYMIQHQITPTEKELMPFAFGLYLFQILGYSVLFSYLYIRAKQDVYKLQSKFSGEFFIRVCLTFFGFSVLSTLGIYLCLPYVQKFLISSMMALPISNSFPWGRFIIQILLPMLACSLILGYLWSAVYMAYIMHFNFQRFGYKFLQVLKHPLVYLQILGWGILFLLITLLPIFILGFIASIGQVSSYIMGTSGSTLLTITLILFALVIVASFIFTKAGRWATLLFSLLYFIIYGLAWIALKQSGLPVQFSTIPVSAFLYLYLFWFIFCSIMVMLCIILPTGLIHLIVQGTFQIHKTFEPSVDKQISLPSESTSEEENPENIGNSQ